MARPEPIAPGPGQESVWDYPRPPAIAPSSSLIIVRFGGATVAETRAALKVMETSHPPSYYLPPDDIEMQHLSQTAHTSVCEYKGRASYFNVTVGDAVAHNAAWAYPSPSPGYEELRDYVAFYPELMEECLVDGERVMPQPGRFYGGWVTSAVVGPFKGEPGTMGW